MLGFLSAQCFIVLYYYSHKHNYNSKSYHYYDTLWPVYIIFKFFQMYGDFLFSCFAVLLLYCGFHYPSFHGVGIPVHTGYSHHITKQCQPRIEVQQPDK